MENVQVLSWPMRHASPLDQNAIRTNEFDQFMFCVVVFFGDIGVFRDKSFDFGSWRRIGSFSMMIADCNIENKREVETRQRQKVKGEETRPLIKFTKRAR